MLLTKPTLIVVCGQPASGKTTIARIIQNRLNSCNKNPTELKVHFIDNDDVRRTCIGPPHPHSKESPELMKRDSEEMSGVYKLLFYTAEWHLAHRRSLVLTASFTRKTHWTNLMRAMDAHHIEMRAIGNKRTALRIIQCVLKNENREEIEKRLKQRTREYLGSLNSWDHYLEVRKRYEPIELPHCEIDTSHPCTPEECAEKAVQYILS